MLTKRAIPNGIKYAIDKTGAPVSTAERKSSAVETGSLPPITINPLFNRKHHMTRHIEEISDVETVQDLLHPVQAFLTFRSMSGPDALVKKQGWIAVPDQAGLTDDEQQGFYEALRTQGESSFLALPLEPALSAYRVPATLNAIADCERTCCLFNYAFVNSTYSWCILLTTDNYKIVVGEEPFVRQVLGNTVEQTFADFLTYAQQPFWGEFTRALTYIHDWLLVYNHALPGETVIF